MKIKKIKQLLEAYYAGDTTLADERELREQLSDADLPGELRAEAEQFGLLDRAGNIQTGTDPFAKIEALSDAQSGEDATGRRALVWLLRVAAGIILLLTGFSAGLLVGNMGSGPNAELQALQKEVRAMKGALVYGRYAESTASQRISAVKRSARISVDSQSDSDEITNILIYTMNNDPNINVRLSAAEALFRFRAQPHIRTSLVNALNHQSAPIMQITLIDMLVQLKERSALNEMQKLLMDSDTRDIVKSRLRDGIAELKT